jgi:hypothetical protein
MRTHNYLSLVKALALAKLRGQRTFSLFILSLLTAWSLLIGATAWAAPKLEVYNSTTTFDATTAVANGSAVDLLLTGTAAPFPTTINKTFTVKNTGADPLVVSSFTLARNANPVPATALPALAGAPLDGMTGTGTVNPTFSQPALTSTNIAPGATATFSVLFDTGATTITALPNPTNPLYFLTFTGTVQIISNDGGNAGSLFKIPVNGILGTNGAADIRLLDDQGNEIQSCGAAPTAPCTAAGATPPNPPYNQIIDFGSISLGGKTVSKTFTLKNIGTAAAPLTAGGATVVANATEATVGVTAPVTLTTSGFTVSTNYPTTTPLAPGATTSFTITLNTAAANTFGALINVADNNAKMLPAANAVFSVKDNAVADVTLPPYFTTPSTANPAGITNATVGRFGVVGRVTPLPIADVVVGGTTPVADGATDPVDFGVLLVGDTTNNTKTFTVRNASTAPPVTESQLTLTNPISLTGTGFSLTQAGAPNFAVTTLASSLPPAALNGTDFKVMMDTSKPGSFVGEISFVNNDATKTPYNFKIKGAVVSSLGQEIEVWYGTPAEVTAGTATAIASGKPPALGTQIDFSTKIGTNVTKTFTIRNIGGTPLTLNYLSTPLPAGFTLASTFPSVIQGGQMDSFDITLNGQTAGTYGGTLNIFNDDKANSGDNDGMENPFNFRVNATVTVPAPKIQVSDDAGTVIDIKVPTKIDFGTKPQGTNVPKIFTVKNVGDKDLTLSSVATVAGTGFTVNSFNPGPVAPGATTTFTVTLDGSNAGTFNADVSFTDDDSTASNFKFPVTAIVQSTPPANQAIEVWYGTPADITAGTANAITDGTATTPGTAIDLDNFDVGASVIKTFTIRNIGSKDLNLFGVSSGSGISIVGALPVTIIAGSQATFDVKVETSVATTSKPPVGGTFQIFNNDPSKTPFDFPLTATVGPLTPPSQTATLNVTVKGTGSVDSTAPAGVGITDCSVAGGTNCSAVLPPSTSAVTLTAKGGTVTWSGTDCKVGATPDTAIVTVSPTATVLSCAADFAGAVTIIPLTVKVTGTGTGSVDSTTPAGIGIAGCTAAGGTCTGNVPAATTSVILTATPADANTTVAWGPGCSVGTEPNTGTVAIASGATTADCTVAFTAGTPPVANLPLTVTVTGNGSVDSVVPKTFGITSCAASGGTCTANVLTGTTTVVLSAKPVANETVTWGGDCDGTGYTGVVTVASGITALTCTVAFTGVTPPPVTTSDLTVTIVGNGSLTSTPAGINACTSAAPCTAKFSAGTVTLAATTPNPTDTVAWSADCTGTGNTGSVDIVIGTPATCTATITTVIPTDLTVTVLGNGSVTSSPAGINACTSAAPCTAKFPAGTVTLTATPANPTDLVAWSAGCTGTGNTSTVNIVSGAAAIGCAVTISTTSSSQASTCFENQNGVYLNNVCQSALKLLAGAVDKTGVVTPTTAQIDGGSAKPGSNYVNPNTVMLLTDIVIAGSIKAAAEDIGKQVDVVVAGIYYMSPSPNGLGFAWYMLNGKNNTCETCVEPWDFNSRDLTASLATLTAFKTGIALPAYLPIQAYAGQFVVPGYLDVYLGYRITAGVDVGKLVFNSLPISMTIR